MELRIEQQARGVRIIAGKEAKARRVALDKLIRIAEAYGFDRMMLAMEAEKR